MITYKENIAVTKKLIKDWHLGPRKAYEDLLHTNKDFWSSIGKLWYISIEEARRRNCGNCEWGNTTPKALQSMEPIKMSPLDMDGGGRVWCEKFDFICHNLRVCAAWDKKSYTEPEEDNSNNDE